MEANEADEKDDTEEPTVPVPQPAAQHTEIPAPRQSFQDVLQQGVDIDRDDCSRRSHEAPGGQEKKGLSL